MTAHDIPILRRQQCHCKVYKTWLSRGKLLSAIYKNWALLQKYFENVTAENHKLTPDQRYKARELLRMVQANVNHLYLAFALPVVTEFERVNALF